MWQEHEQASQRQRDWNYIDVVNSCQRTNVILPVDFKQQRDELFPKSSWKSGGFAASSHGRIRCLMDALARVCVA